MIDLGLAHSETNIFLLTNKWFSYRTVKITLNISWSKAHNFYNLRIILTILYNKFTINFKNGGGVMFPLV